MTTAKDLIVKPISSKDARRIVRKLHYSGKVVQNSVLHLGVFLNGNCEGVMQFGGSIDKRRMLPVVSGTKWNEILELNRMAFSDALPRNSESRAISVAMRLIKKRYPQIKWVISFADGCQCGDGTIYRASGFQLIGIKKNSTLLMTESGEVVADKTFNNSINKKYKGLSKSDCSPIVGHQLKYIYFIDKSYRERLTVPELPFSDIDKMGAGMYKGIKRVTKANSSDQLESGGAIPTHTLQSAETYVRY